MAYSWTQQAEREGGGESEKLPVGRHHVFIARVIRESRGELMTSKSGDPQILVIVSDQQGREGGIPITLSQKGAWVLARLLARCTPPADLARMEQEGIEPQRFADQHFADTQLLNRKLVVDVDWGERGDAQYPDVVPVREEEPASQPAATPPQQPPTQQSPAPPQQPPSVLGSPAADQPGDDDEIPF